MTDLDLVARIAWRTDDARAALEELMMDGRVQRLADGRIEAIDFVIPRGAEAGWEAAVFDHVQAVVQTICQRLRRANQKPAFQRGVEQPMLEQHPVEHVGGSTYSFDLGPDHPLASEVKNQLEAVRQRLTELRQRVDSYNRYRGLPAAYEQVVTYVGQCILEKEHEYGSPKDQDIE